MGRPKENPDLFVKTYAWWAKSGRPSAAAVRRHLEEDPEQPEISPATIRRWVTDFKNLSADVISLDQPFEWNRMDEQGLPWEAGRILLHVLMDSRWGATEIFEYPQLTVRLARWCWRIHLAAPTINPEDLVQIARAFSGRELRRDLFNEPLNIVDLETWLVIEPWKDGQLPLYFEALKRGAPPLKVISDSDLNAATDALLHKRFSWIAAHFAVGAFWPRDPEPWLLPSQRWAKERAEGKQDG